MSREPEIIDVEFEEIPARPTRPTRRTRVVVERDPDPVEATARDLNEIGQRAGGILARWSRILAPYTGGERRPFLKR